MPVYASRLLQMREVWDHPLREKLLLLLLLLPQSELSLQLSVGQLRLSSISSNASKTAEELLLSLRSPAAHIQAAEKVMSNQPLEVVLLLLLLSRTETDLRSATTADSQSVSALEVGIVSLLLRETIRMRVKHVLVVL